MSLLKVFAVLILGAAQITAGRSVSGTVRLNEGGPAAGVRVVAVVVPGAGRGGPNAPSVLASLTQADKDGRYQLEDIPPGRYYIAAGALDSPTFYPGTLAQSEARIVTITQNGSALSGMDFALSKAAAAPPLPPIAANLPCCNLYGVLLPEDGSLLPDVPLRVVDTRNNLSVMVYDGLFRFSLRRGAIVQLAIEGLPPGYALKSVVYGGRNAGPTLQIDGRQPESFLLTLSVQPGSASPKVTARGKVVNIARELKPTSLRLVLTPTVSNGTTLVATVRPDFSFELPEVPFGTYRTGVRPEGSDSLWVTSTVAVIRGAVSDLTIDLADNPFPELGGSISLSMFAEDKETTITGVVTQPFTDFRTRRSGYFRMNVTDQRTGVITPWALYVENYGLIPNIKAGETYTVQGTAALDGTNRLRVKPF